MKINQPKYPIQYPIHNKPNDKMEPIDDNDYGHFYDLDYENFINYYPFSREKYKQKISKNLKDQLKDGGRIISIFTDGAMGQCFLGIKKGSDITWRSEFDASAPIIKDFSEPKSFTFV